METAKKPKDKNIEFETLLEKEQLTIDGILEMKSEKKLPPMSEWRR